MPEIKKVNEQIFDAAADSVKKLAEVFPAAVRDGQVDFEALKQELGQFEETGPERYGLTWSNKSKAKNLAHISPVARTLKYIPEDSKHPDTTQNLYIEGDNLEVLQLLRQNYYGKIKMIYIDPPYNTGKDFIYRDKFTMDAAESDAAEGDIDEEGNRLVVNQKSNNRYHANWLNMIYPRLKVAKDLLTKDGVIFINIDDNEVHNLRAVCDEVFGAENLVACFVWKGRGGRQDSEFYAVIHEYILCYAKLVSEFSSGELMKDGDYYSKFDELKNRRYKTQLARKWGSNSRRADRPNLFYSVTAPDGTKLFPMINNKEEGCWRWSKIKMEKELSEGNLDFVKDGDKWILYERIYEPAEDEVNTKKYTTWIDNVGVGIGSKLLKNLFGVKLFDYPKPIELIKQFIQMADVGNEFILDFFSGSGTTAHAVMQLNAEDGGNRKFIMIQIPEELDPKRDKAAIEAGYKNICEIGKERIRRAGEKIMAEWEKNTPEWAKHNDIGVTEENHAFPEEQPNAGGIRGEPAPARNVDVGFKVFRTADTNIQWTKLAAGQIVRSTEDMRMTDKDRLDFTPQFTDLDVVYEVMLRQNDIPLSSSVRLLSNIGERTYLFADAYLVCLEENLTSEMIEQMAATDPAPVKYILRDSAFDDNISLKDETIRRLQAYVAREHKNAGITYTVEFI